MTYCLPAFIICWLFGLILGFYLRLSYWINTRAENRRLKRSIEILRHGMSKFAHEDWEEVNPAFAKMILREAE